MDMHRFRITVEPIATETSSAALQFEVNNHDDILAIAQRVPTRLGLDEDETRALIVGAKLLGEVILKHRAEEPFSQLRPALREFMQQMKREPGRGRGST